LKTIEITVTPTGQTSVETKGFSGADCRQASAFIEAALGQRTGERLTSEFYALENQSQQLQEGA
jgi:hypothetical protein